MPPPTKSRIFFDEDTIIAEKWSLDRIAKAAHPLLPPDPGYHLLNWTTSWTVISTSWSRLPAKRIYRWKYGKQPLSTMMQILNLDVCHKRNRPGGNFTSLVLQNINLL